MNEFDKILTAEIMRLTDQISEAQKTRDATTDHETPQWRDANLRIYQLTEARTAMKLALAAYKKCMR